MMNRRGFLASLLAPFVARLLPKPKPVVYGLFNPKQNVAKLWAHHPLFKFDRMNPSITCTMEAAREASAKLELVLNTYAPNRGQKSADG